MLKRESPHAIAIAAVEVEPSRSDSRKGEKVKAQKKFSSLLLFQAVRTKSCTNENEQLRINKRIARWTVNDGRGRQGLGRLGLTTNHIE